MVSPEELDKTKRQETNPEIDNNLGVQKIEEKLNPLLTD